MLPVALADGRSRGRTLAAVIVAALVLIVAAFALGRFLLQPETTPNSTSAAAGFARDMQVHHDQAVQMSLLIRDRSTDEDMRTLAYDIARTQSQQSGQMYGWLASWGLPQASPEPSMTWMTRPGLTGATHAHSSEDGSAHVAGEPMPGLATREQIAELTAASGVEAERLFLELMIAHHEGGIEMAEAALDRTTTTVVVDLATGIVRAQASEIELMQNMLDALRSR